MADDEYEGAPDQLAERMAELDESLAEQKAEVMRASLADYDLDEEDADLLEGVTLGEDAFIKPEFATNPDRRMFGASIDAMLEELRQRRSRAVIEAEQTIERLTRTLEEFRR